MYFVKQRSKAENEENVGIQGGGVCERNHDSEQGLEGQWVQYKEEV